MASVVVIGISEDGYAALFDLVAEIHPTVELAGAVHDYFVPGLGEVFDFLAVAEPADVGPIRGYGIKFVSGGERHPALVLQRESDAVIAEKLRERGIQPVLIANLDRELVALWKLFEEWFQPGGELRAAGEDAAIEIGKLEQHGAEFFAKDLHGLHELFEFGVAIDEDFFVRDSLRHFHREDEIFRSLARPPSTVDADGAR